ncbi:MAG TPA: DUF255 domain-containing protein [Flavihumibacter sp.]|jgi:thioredoxin-related protein
MQRLIALIIVLLAALPVPAQKKAKTEIKWMTLREAEAAAKKSPRPILIDLYTDWCGWCKVMDKRTYRHPEVVQYLNDNFYNIKLDAEARVVYEWMGKKYAYNADYRTNEIALYFTGGQLSYPTTVIIPAPGMDPQAIPGFMAPHELEPVVKYIGEGIYRKTSFTDYQKQFKRSW